MSWIRLASLSRLPVEEPVKITMHGHDLVLVRMADCVHAVGETCSHERASMADGFVDEGCIECPRHGARFELSTGKPLTLPATQPLPRYDVKVEGDHVYVDLEEQ